jgi:TonB family protein
VGRLCLDRAEKKFSFASVGAMPPIVKENETSSAKPDAAQRPSTTPASDSSVKQQPVALEVPVTVNGARSVDGSDKREPFSETTKTVLVFGTGAVIRLTSSVAPGQLLFLTNEKTEKEVVCQVVKSKNYRNVSGYVELEFTESVVGFWGMRFPTDRIGAAPQQTTSPVPASSAVPAAGGSPAIPRPTAAQLPSNVLPAKPAPPASVVRAAEPKLAEAKFVAPEPSKVEEVPQKPVAPIAPLSSTIATSFDPAVSLNKPAAPANPAMELPSAIATPKPVTPAPSLFDAPRTSDAPASFLEPSPSKGSTTPEAGSVQNLLSLFEAKPSAPAVVPPPPAPPAADPEMEALKQHTARLQEQLSNMMFSDKPAQKETVSVELPHVPPVAIQKDLAENAAKVLEMSRPKASEPMPAKPVELAKTEVAKTEPALVKSSLEDEQLKIPAWLEPLARNAAAPTSTQDLIEREKAKRLADAIKAEEAVPAAAAPVVEEAHAVELPVPSFVEPAFLAEEKSDRESPSAPKSSGKGLLIGAIAAGIIVLAGGGRWYMQQQSGSTHAASSNAQASVTSLPSVDPSSSAQPNAPSQTNSSANSAPLANAPAQSSAASNQATIVPAVSTTPVRNSQAPSSRGNNEAAVSASSRPEPEEPKKPILGEVHLATPTLANHKSQNPGEPDAGLTLSSEEQPGANADLNSGLVGSSKQPSAPAAPLPVGGDVKVARPLSTVPPIYPSLARTQRIAGDVLVDALIDANGRVTTMKVVSGPTLLHQAAMDALRQWKYQPATLDGKPVSMHLTVTIQFRLQ